MELESGERAKFWREETYDSLECLKATFLRHEFSPHTHETFVIGAVVSGYQRHKLKGSESVGGPGSVFMINPEDVHDGRPMEMGYSYRMFYPSVKLMDEIAAGLPGKRQTGSLFFRDLMLEDARIAQALIQTHNVLETSPDQLEKDEAIFCSFGALIDHYGSWSTGVLQKREPKAIEHVCEYMHAHFGDDINLEMLANIAGMSRAYFVRVFRKHMNQTPHSYLTDIRIRGARKMLHQGQNPMNVAIDCGFFDQSHLNRQFKRRIGTTPGAFKDMHAQ
ncbi:AraC family transcriptional regulator [Maritalea sp.]|uniref:AraC family transcriptional regulator n=1 Tax=Maritalea sp. TaxID=2003361 RepID=UPI003EF2970F